MFDDARAQGRPAVVVATGMHRRWIEADLHQRCIAFEGDVCRLLDADTTLSSLLVDGEPDRDRFRSVIGTLLSDVCSRNPGGVSVYGEMVGLLWSEGRVAAAMRLEESGTNSSVSCRSRCCAATSSMAALTAPTSTPSATSIPTSADIHRPSRCKRERVGGDQRVVARRTTVQLPRRIAFLQRPRWTAHSHPTPPAPPP